MRLYIIRHADPDYINGTITERGHKEAQALSERLEKEGITSIYSSPLERAVHTMQYTADRLNLDYHILDWAEEIPDLRLPLPVTGIDGFHAAWDTPAEILLDASSYKDKKMDVRNAYVLNEIKDEIESRTAYIKKNSDSFIESLGYSRQDHKYRIVNDNREKVAVFCHGGLGLTWLSHLLSVPYHIMWSSFWMPPSSVSIILFDKRSPEWAVPRALTIGDTSHLYKSSLEISPRGIIANFD
jgi:probable phosphoglycerate mutase